MSENKPPTSEGSNGSREVPSGSAVDTFCVNPWSHVRLESDGQAQVCCIFRGGIIAEDGSPMSLQRHSMEEIWNSDAMRGIRRDMVEGRSIAGCNQCYKDEARGGHSMRMRDNANWEGGFLNEDRLTIEELKLLAVENEFNLSTFPALIEIDTGSLCNLKCRMCHDMASSLIAKDPVHSSWTADQYSAKPYHDASTQPRQPPLRRFLSLKSFLQNELPGHRGEVKRLYFIGGEPLLVQEVRAVLEGLIDAGLSRDIELAVVSNGTVTPDWLKMATQFKRVDLAISIDGYGKYYDYIRYPGRWEDLTENIRFFKKLPNVNLGAAVTIQINNALHVTDLFRYFDSIGVGFYAYPLHVPRYLAIGAMPAAIRRLAADRLRAYGENDCLPNHRDLVLSLARQLEPSGETFDAGLLRDFMLFTNDLDVTRGQNIREVDEELVGLLAQAGLAWTEETLHAPAGAKVAPRRAGVIARRLLAKRLD
jgi:MoaA/NifB/PqqE/SkfB family radical SAM enzyme